MSEPIRVALARECDLLDVGTHLTSCGFTTARVDDEGTMTLEVTSSGQSQERFDTDVRNALEAWLESGDRPLVPRRVAECRYALTPPGE